MAATACTSAPAATSDCLSTSALRALATNETWRAFSASASRSACMSRRPCVATTTHAPADTRATTAAMSSVAMTCCASAKSAGCASCATTLTAKPTRGASCARLTATGEAPITTNCALGSTGSMNNSSVPPEWHAMPNSSTSPSTVS